LLLSVGVRVQQTIDRWQSIKYFAYIIRDAWDNSVLICWGPELVCPLV